jgi:Radical SAM superfamily/B12 binding domain
MRVLLVDNLLLELRDGRYRFDLLPHLGLLSLVAVAETGGHEAILYDPKLDVAHGRLGLTASLYGQIADIILGHSPDVLGLTSLGCNFICTAKIAARVRERRPDLPIVLGGPHATILDRHILESFRQFDVIVRNEAEGTLLPLLDAIHGGDVRKIPGITFRDGDAIISNPGEPLIADLDDLPWPAYDHWPITKLGLKSTRIEAGRGCPFSCTFCSTASFFGRRYRLKSADRICAEMDYLHERYGISDFALTHDLFTVNRGKVIDFCDRVASRNYSWACSARMDCVDEELLSIMRSAGCRSIYYGLETGSERMQKIVEKKQDLSMVDPILDTSSRLGLFSTVSLITGYPQEMQADQDDTLDLVGRCFLRDPSQVRIQLHLLTPEPGTKLLQDFDHSLKYDGHITDFIFPTLESDDAAIMASLPRVFMNHHYFSSVVPRDRHVFVTSIFAALYELGSPMVRHLRAIYADSCSRLVADIYAWSRTHPELRSKCDECLVSFVRATWGDDHYLYSLVRYLVTANRLSVHAEMRRSSISRRDCFTSDHEPTYRLSSCAAVLRDLHDCQRIIALMGSGMSAVVELPDALAREKADYCIVVELGEERLVRNLLLDEGWAQVLDDDRPRSSREIEDMLARLVGPAAELSQVLDSLVAEGIFEATPASTECPAARSHPRVAECV